MNIKMYVLGLLEFKDGKIVFSEEELGCICNKIGECILKSFLAFAFCIADMS